MIGIGQETPEPSTNLCWAVILLQALFKLCDRGEADAREGLLGLLPSSLHCLVSDRGQIQRLIQAIALQLPRDRTFGALHSAGCLTDR
jgi:hypothetical protein